MGGHAHTSSIAILPVPSRFLREMHTHKQMPVHVTTVNVIAISSRKASTVPTVITVKKQSPAGYIKANI